MRRRPIILLLLATAASMSAAIALADPPSTGPAAKALGVAPYAQNGPALAVNPAGGGSIAAAVVGTDWRNGSQAPLSAFSSGAIVAATGATTWNPQTTLPHVGQDLSRGFPDVAWGPGNKVYAVEVVRDATAPANPCLQGAGIYLFVSNDGGVTWAAPLDIAANGGQANTDPSIAYDAQTGRIYVAYTRTDPCTANPGDPGASSQIRLATLARDDAVGGVAISPLPTGSVGDPQFVRPAVAVLPNGYVEVAYYDASTPPGRVMATMCTPPVGMPLAPDCRLTTPTFTIDPSSLDPGMRSIGGATFPVHVRPSIAADPSGRVVVTWAELSATTGMDVLSATSIDAGAHFGDPQVVSGGSDGGGVSDQINPAVAITPGGRADVAFLDSRSDPGNSFKVSVAASNRPAGTVETWSPSVAVDSTPIVPAPPFVPGGPSLGTQIAVAELKGPWALPWTLVAWTDSRNVTGAAPSNEDVYTTVLKHGATPPSGLDVLAVQAPRNTTMTIPITASDAEADPLTFSIAQQGTYGTASVSDPNRPFILYEAPSALVADAVKVRVSDGVNSTTLIVNIQTVNTPPTIGCGSLSTPVNKPVLIPATCADDANHDVLTLAASNPAHGRVEGAGATLSFVPEKDYVGTGFVTLTASDGFDASAPKTIPVTIGTPGEVVVSIAGADIQSTYTDRPIKLSATPVGTIAGAAAAAAASKITWTYGDGTAATDQGPTVTHLFPTAGRFDVTARVGSGPPDSVTITVTKPPFTIRRTEVGPGGAMAVRVQLATAGKLAIGLVGVQGAHQRKLKLKRGTHTVRMQLPAGARTRGTVLVKLKLTMTAGGSATLKRAVLLPSG
jgi:hypothetical protein